MTKNSYNFKIFLNWDVISNRELGRKILKGISDVVYIYFLSISKQNPERIEIIDEFTGEIKSVYKEPYRYLYTDTFTKTEVAKR